MIKTLISVLVLIQAQSAVPQQASENVPASSVELYQLKVTALGLGPAVVVPENLADGQKVLAELTKSPEITWRRQIVTPVVPGTKLEWQAGEQTPVVTGFTLTPRGGGEPVRSYSQMNTGTSLTVADLTPFEGGVSLQFQFESSRLDRSAVKPDGPIEGELQTQMQQCQFRGTLLVPEGRTVVIQASQTAASGNEIPGHVLIFVSVEKHP